MEASDAAGFGAFATFTVTASKFAPGDGAPTVTAASVQKAPGLSLAPSSLFSRQRAARRDRHELRGRGHNSDSGHWVFNGVVEPTNQLIDVTVAQLSQLSFVTGYGSDTLMVRANDGTQWGSFTTFTVTPPPNSAPPAGTTAVMVMSNPSNGDYEIYDVGGNAILAAYSLGQVGSPWTFVGLGTLQAGDTSDMLLRNTSTGGFEAYYISNNNITNAALIGTVGTNWNFAGTGDFDGQSSLSELLLRNSASGSFELYQVAGGGVLSGSSVAAVGNNLQVSGFGNFSGSSTTQMIMEQANEAPGTNAYWLYTYNPSSAAFAGHVGGTVGNNLSVVGFGDLLGNGETQMVMQQSNGNFWLYTYQPSTNSLSGTLRWCDRQQFPCRRLWSAQHFRPGRNADAGRCRRFRGLPIQRHPQCIRR